MILPFKNIKNYVFDLDGTIWTFRELCPNAEYVIERIRKKGKSVIFTTNNTIMTREELASRLTNLGVRARKDEIISAGYVAARYFEEKGINDVHVIGEHGLMKELSDAGVNVRDEADNVLLSLDRNFNFMKLKKAAELVNSGAELYCTGISKYFRAGTELYPAEAPAIRALETLTGKMPIHLGKPSDMFKTRISQDYTIFPEDTLMVGDDLKEDIMFANKCGFKSALILTGNTSKEKADDAKSLEKPGAIITDLKDILIF